MTLQRSLAAGVGLIAITCGALLYGDAQNDTDKAGLERQLGETLKARVESAETAYAAMRDAFDAETVTLDTLEDAIRKLADAEVAAATTPQEVTAALQKNVERTKSVEAKIRRLFEVATRGGEAKDYFSAKRDRETAEIMLLTAQVKQ